MWGAVVAFFTWALGKLFGKPPAPPGPTLEAQSGELAAASQVRTEQAQEATNEASVTARARDDADAGVVRDQAAGRDIRDAPDPDARN